MKLSEDQGQELRAAGAMPVRVADPETGQEYVVIRADVFERLREAPDDDLPDLREMALLIQQGMAEEDADDPLLERYRNLPE
jgi:hypothetical protein